MVALFRTISDSENFIFCNFSGHFLCLSGQGEILTFSPYKADSSAHEVPAPFPGIGPGQAASFAVSIPNHFPSRHPIVSALSEDNFEQVIFSKEINHFYSKLALFWERNHAYSSRKVGHIRDEFWGSPGGIFSSKQSPCQGRI